MGEIEIMNTALIWFRNDLRIHDHAILARIAEGDYQRIIPFYCFDDRQFQTTSFGFAKTGKYRAKFLIESVADLRESLQKLGTDLIVRKGIPEQIIPDIAKQYNVTEFYFSQEATEEEIKVEKRLIKALKQLHIQVKSCWQSTLYQPDDLPFSIENLPDLFTHFRKQIEKKSIVEECFETPKNYRQFPPLTQEIFQFYQI